jgi:hypothetical protein
MSPASESFVALTIIMKRTGGFPSAQVDEKQHFQMPMEIIEALSRSRPATKPRRHTRASNRRFRACMTAAITRSVFPASWSCIISPRADGTICQDRPNLSFSQPHCPCSPPSESLSQKPSSSACVRQLTDSEMASVNLKYGPPFNAWKRCPSGLLPQRTHCYVRGFGSCERQFRRREPTEPKRCRPFP